MSSTPGNTDGKAAQIYLAKWIGLALAAAAVGSLTVQLFRFLLYEITGFLQDLELPLPIWSLAGALISGGIIYRLQPEAAGEGIPSYLRGLNLYHGRLPFSVTLFKYLSALCTLCTFGNGGVVGPLGRVSAGIMSTLSGRLRHLGFKDEDRHTATICGLAAAMGAIFHSPLGGGLFAVEIIQRARMSYKDVFPALLSSIASVILCRAVGFQPVYLIEVPDQQVNLSLIGWVPLFAVLLGFCGGFYTRFYAHMVRLFKRDRGNILLKVSLGTLIASLAAWLINPELMGTSGAMFRALFDGEDSVLAGLLQGSLPLLLILLIMPILKALLNCITVGSGMSAGFTGPTILIGMLLGSVFARTIGLQYPSPGYYTFIAVGFSGLLASAMNVPLAAAVMTVEIFGLAYSLPAGLAAIISFQINRHQTIYDYALAGAGHRTGYSRDREKSSGRG